MKHLVLGSAGQIGGHLCKYLKSVGEEVITFDIKDDISEDLRDFNNSYLNECIKDCDLVYFLAFDVGGAKYLEKHQDTFQFIDNNMRIMFNTFSQLKNYKKPFIFASSQMSELGYSSYGQLKSLGEKMTYDLGGKVVRFWNVYGYEPEGEHSHVITDLCKMAKYKREIKVRTDGTEKRQFIYAEDVCEILYKFTDPNYFGGLSVDQKAFDITSGTWVSIQEIAYIIAEIADLGKDEVYFAARKDQTQKDAQNEAKNIPYDRDENNHHKGFWSPKISLEEGIKQIYDNI